MKILAIDDDYNFLHTLKDIIEQYLPQHEVILTVDGLQGLELARSIDPAVLLLDLVMPRIGGYDICKTLKLDPKTNHIPIIIMTGMESDYSMKAKSLDAGADAFLTKPLEIPDLISQIKAMLRLRNIDNLLREERDKLKHVLDEKSNELHKRQERWELIQKSTNEGIWDWNVVTGETMFSDHWMENLGYHPGELEPSIQSFYMLIDPKDLDSIQHAIDDYLQKRTAHFHVEIPMKCKDGRLKWFSYRGQAVWDEDGQPTRLVGIQADITERKLIEKKLQHIAHHDTLTGLPNRVLSLDRLVHNLARASRFKNMIAVLFADLDGFKQVNDKYGHNVGDVLLQQVARRFEHCVRRVDTVSRFGGDEFLIILADLKTKEDAVVVANRIVTDISRPYEMNSHLIEISVSLGLSLYPNDSDDAEALIKYADIAMYKAKNSGKKQFRFYSPQFSRDAGAFPVSAIELSEAIDSHDIEIEYLPHFDLEGGRIGGLEAIMTWKKIQQPVFHPEHLFNPNEHTDIFHRLLLYQFEMACNHLNQWNHIGKTDRVQINVAAGQFFHMNLTKDIQRILEEHSIDGNRFILGVNENTILQDIDFSAEILGQFTQIGFEIALIEFGTGYLSLQHFINLPIHIIKIDSSFIQRIGTESKIDDMIVTIIRFARSIHARAVAAGVHTEVQKRFLQENGCRVIQGEYCSEPLAPDTIDQAIRENTC